MPACHDNNIYSQYVAIQTFSSTEIITHALVKNVNIISLAFVL